MSFWTFRNRTELSKVIRISVFYQKKISKFNSIVLKWTNLCKTNLSSVEIRFVISVQLLTVLSNFRTSRKLRFIRYRYIKAIL